MKCLRGILAILVLFLLFGNVSADDSYEITLDIMRPNDMNDLDNTTWTDYETIVLDKNERVESIHQIMVLDVALETDTIFIEVIKDGERFTDFLKEGEAATFGEEDEMDFKISVESIEEGGSSSSSSNVIFNDDDVVAVWIAPNSVDKLPLSDAIPESFNPSEYGKSTGWSGTGSVETVDLYIERVQEIEGVTISITGGDWDEVSIDIDDRRKFELNENAVYVITIDYEKEDVWGGISDEREVFTLSLTGLTYGTNTGTIPSSSTTTTTGDTYTDTTIDSFNAVPNTYVIVETETKGVWEEVDGAIVKFDAETSSGDYSWKVKFDTEGTHKIGYKETDGTSGYYRFVVKEVVQAVATVAAGQTETGDKTSTGTIFAVIGILLLLGAGTMFYKKKSRNNNANGNDGIRTTPDIDT